MTGKRKIILCLGFGIMLVVTGPVRAADDDDDQPQRTHRWHASECRIEVRREGNEHLTESAAKKAAEVAWMGAVRFRDGERYMAIENARDVKYSCVRSSVGDTPLGATVSAVGGNYHRCQMAAHPCQAPETRDGLKAALPAAKKK